MFHPPCDMFGVRQENFKPFKMPVEFFGTTIMIAGEFNYTEDVNGVLVMYPEGDTSVPPSGKDAQAVISGMRSTVKSL